MITLDLVQKMWSLITHPEKDSEVYEANEIDSISTPFGHPLLTIDTTNLRHFLIPISENSNALEDKQSAGVHVLINKWKEGNKKRRFIDLVCRKPHLNGIFDLVVFEILHLIETDSLAPEKASQVVLQRWRELLSREPSGTPDKIFVIGVLGELFLLKDLVAVNPDTIDYWLGPNGHRYDFYSGHKALEVKATTRKRERLITIHGIDQLSYQSDTKLYLAILRLEETPQIGITVSQMVRDIVALGCDQTKLFMKLAFLGMSPEVIVKCDEFRYVLREQIFYEVDQDFPRITEESFTAGKFFGQIVDVSYQIDLSSQPPIPLQQHEIIAVCNSFAKGE
jgi:hypothetical protein